MRVSRDGLKAVRITEENLNYLKQLKKERKRSMVQILEDIIKSYSQNGKNRV